MIENLLAQGLSGLASASSLFLVASGLTVIFGVTRIVNFAHGSLYMLGAFLAWTLVTNLPRGHLGFWGGLLAAALIVGLIGVAIEVLLLRRIYRAPELFQLLATFGVVLIVQDLALLTWGPQDLLGPRAPGLRGATEILGVRFPLYDLFLICVGPVVLALLWLLFHRTRWGTLVRAATADREMVAALGVNQRVLFTTVFFLGSVLAGLGGALQIPRESVNLQMDLAVIAEAFVVVVVGGLGSLGGAFLAALLLGLMQAFGILILPKITLVLAFLVMAVVLVVRPHGLLGRAPTSAHHGQAVEPPFPPASPWLVRASLALLALAVVVPPFLGDFTLIVFTEIAVMVLFAASLHFIMGPGGMASFGHAAYFGLGAYGAALLAKHFAAPMELGLLAAPFAAGLAGVVFGWFCVRLSGVYAAMLTLAFAQIAWSTAFQWVELTGGDNGILGVWPSAWAQSKLAYYYLALALCTAATLLLRRAIFAPFGYALRAGRDSPLRAESIGMDGFRIRWAAFILAALAAGIAGGLFAYAKGSVFPTYMAIPRSVDALLMVLLGGVQTVSGPIIGALAYTWLHEQLMRLFDLWRLLLGSVILALVLFFPQGLAGTMRQARVTPSATLQVSDIHKSFGGVHAVAGVSLSVAPGELLALIGPNGAGKSTCFNMLNGQLRPDSGTVRLNGEDITGLPPRRIWRLGVGRTFQITATFSSMSVLENVQMALLSHARRVFHLWRPVSAEDPAPAMALLERVGMAAQSARPCGVLAYGDLKRVELAIALANQPSLLLMDEPTAGMAPSERVALMELTARIAREGRIAVLFTEHDMDVVFSHADRILVLDRGRPIAEGLPAEVRADPRVREVYLGTGATHGYA